MQYVCTDRDFDTQTRTAVLQPWVCQIAVRLYVRCMVVVARPYYTILCTSTLYKLYGRRSAIILYTVHARGARGVCAPSELAWGCAPSASMASRDTGRQERAANREARSAGTVGRSKRKKSVPLKSGIITRKK